MDAEQYDSPGNTSTGIYGGGRLRAQTWKNKPRSGGAGEHYCNYTQMLFWYEGIEAGNTYVPATDQFKGPSGESNYTLREASFNFYGLTGNQTKLFADYPKFSKPYKVNGKLVEPRAERGPQRYRSQGFQTQGCPTTAQTFATAELYEKAKGDLNYIKQLAREYKILPGDSIMFMWNKTKTYNNGNILKIRDRIATTYKPDGKTIVKAAKEANYWNTSHIGMYLSVDDSATAVTTIEGNNSSAPMAQALPSNRNGIWKRPRTGSDISKIHGFCRLPVKYLYGI